MYKPLSFIQILSVFCFILLFLPLSVWSQADTEFWFVAPEVSSAHGDRPIYVRLSTHNQPATVTIALPANPSFTPIVVNLTPNSLQTVNLTPHINIIENNPANTILDRGIHITSTTPVSAYYEVAHHNNPGIFPLKGNFALGVDFFIPSQNTFYNQHGSESFEIVATENNTTITITPTENVIGHPANVPFTITLNRGQSFSVRATNTGSGGTLAGSRVVSDKPIAITISDDSIRPPGGGGWDLAGDQLVPVDQLGTDYVVVRGLANIENVYILATANNTQVFLNGSGGPAATLNAGQMFSTGIPGNSMSIQATEPVYVLHVSGSGSELGSTLLPHIDCTGSNAARFVRTTTSSFTMMLITSAGNQNNFLLNGNAGIISGASFAPVPGAPNWVAARLNMNSTGQVPIGVNLLENTTGVFHLAILHNLGGSSVYGYFSGYESLDLGDEEIFGCEGDVITLDAGNTGNTYLWSDGSTNPSLAVTDSGLYWVEVTSGNCVLSDTVLVNIHTIPELSLPADTTLCPGQSMGLSANIVAFDSLLWSDGSTGASISVTSPGTYWVEGAEQCGLFRDSIDVQYDAIPSVNLGNDTLVCEGHVEVLNATFGGILPVDYSWSDGSIGAALTVTDSGTYWVDVSNVCGSNSDTVQFEYELPPQIDLGNDTIICQGTSITLDATYAGLTPNVYFWQNSSTAATQTVSAAGVYWADVLNICGTTRDSIAIQLEALPSVGLGNDTILCTGDILPLDASFTGITPTAYLWSDGNTSPSLTVGDSGMYWVEVSNVCGMVTDSIVVPYEVVPTVDLGADTIPCTGQIISLDASFNSVSPTNYIWQNGTIGNIFNASVSGVYWAEVQNQCGTDRDSILILYDNPPTVFLGQDTLLCVGDTLDLDATFTSLTTTEYLWQDSSTTATYSIADSGLYSVQLTNQCGSATDDIYVLFENIPTPVVDIGADTILCPGASFVIDATFPSVSSTTYTWHDATNNPTYLANAPGLYWVDIQNLCGTISDSIEVEYESIPTVNLGIDTILCTGDVLPLDATFIGITPTTYLWSDSTLGTSFSVDSADKYWVQVSNFCGMDEDSLVVLYEVYPTVNLGNDSMLCAGQSVQWDVSFPSTEPIICLWQDGSNTLSYTANTDGIYWAEVSNRCGVVRDSVSLLFENAPTLDLGADTILCPSTTLLLDASFAGISPTTYVWQDGSTATSLLIDTVGSYWVDIANMCGMASDTLHVLYEDNPTVSLGSDLLLCPGYEVSWDVSLPSVGSISYTWQDATTSPMYTVSGISGTYWVAIENVCGIARDTAIISYEALPTVELGNDTILCAGANLPLDAAFMSVGTTAYLWNTGSIQPTLTVGQAGLYSVQVSNQCGLAVDSILVSYEAPPIVSLGQDTTLCPEARLELDAGEEGITYTWNTGADQQFLTVTSSGFYEVVVANNACSTTDAIEVMYESSRVLELGNDSTLCIGSQLELNADIGIPNAVYIWQDSSSTPIYLAEQTDGYIVRVTDHCGVYQDSVRLEFVDCFCEVYMPNAFSPNGDNHNDVFKPVYFCNIVNAHLVVYNRWGKVVHESNSMDGWNGLTNDGKACPVDSYVWVLEYTGVRDLKEISVKRFGNVTLLR